MSVSDQEESNTRWAKVPVDQIRVYERNPRHIPNPEYDRIKQSIREHGLEHPLIVADCADGVGYVVSAGGNTRLTILKELNAESDDARFSIVECVIRPWQGDVAALIAHLRENDLRGALSFIDRALAVVDVHRLLESAQVKTLSQRQLAAQLTQAGYAIGQGLISPMFYAVQTLSAVLPDALTAGLGRRVVERIRALERGAGKVWKTHKLGAEAEWLETFAVLARRSDSADWSFEAFRGAVELELASAAEAPIQTIRLQIDQALERTSNHRASDPVPPPAFAAAAARSIDVGVAGRTPVDSQTGITDTATQRRADEVSRESLVKAESLAEIPELRQHAWHLAHRLAQRYGLGALVVETPDNGTGFTVVDVPDASVTDDLDPELLGRVSLLWWHLVACAESMSASPAAVLAQLPPHSMLREVLEARDAERLFEQVWTPDPGQVGDLLWRGLPEPDWQDFLELMTAYRRLHQLAHACHQALWAAEEVTEITENDEG